MEANRSCGGSCGSGLVNDILLRMPNRQSHSAAGRILQLDERVARIEELTARLAHQLDVQFKRIAQLQAEVDEMRAASANVKEFRRKSS